MQTVAENGHRNSKMGRVRLKFRWSTLWLLAAAIISAIEIFAASGRSQHAPDIQPPDILLQDIPRECFADISVGEVDKDSVLVLGNLGESIDGEVQIVLTAIASNSASCNLQPTPAPTNSLLPNATQANSNHQSRSGWRESTNFAPKKPHLFSDLEGDCPEETRHYFLQTEIRSLSLGEHSLIDCRLAGQTARVKIFVDQRLKSDVRLDALVQAIASAAESELALIVQDLAGPVRDMDLDQHLAIVVTPEIARLGNGRTPVEGLTRPADFVPGVDRPIGNNSDVIFLSSSLEPGDQLRAVLAHEWCHAAVFSRSSGSETVRGIDEDWLNEALAHVVEYQASGSATNLSHRIRSFLANPHQSPLVVRDYSHPDYWRHDGCRGAGYLFVDWCLNRSGDRLLKQLIDGPSLSAEGISAAMDTPFSDLFREWTVALGRSLAEASPEQPSNQLPGCAEWELAATSPQNLTQRLGGACASYVRIRCPAGTRWQISATVRGSNEIQSTLIPVRPTSSHR